MRQVLWSQTPSSMRYRQPALQPARAVHAMSSSSRLGAIRALCDGGAGRHYGRVPEPRQTSTPRLLVPPTKTFEIKLYSGAAPFDVLFDKVGVVTIGCNIHDWMIAYVYVVDTPYFARAIAPARQRSVKWLRRIRSLSVAPSAATSRNTTETGQQDRRRAG